MLEPLALINDPVLTRRETEILEYITLGLSAKEVALEINISPRTVERHVENVRLKLRARNRTHMVACAVKAGLLRVNEAGVRGIYRLASRNGPLEQM
ncbi:response regulator transcription factor [Sphingorhabdus sp. EL138]|jgi:DNA-binding NarL/FixJ family response regulator|uniref:response regulator transcription factor n=1 Tax=Sphingorhabdus sp. EL138 TaxID=2073156 RepID=UPI000D6979CB|nr:helix-turn-helix transcriptional regulator [Sphingorhabdus sp. EL138]